MYGTYRSSDYLITISSLNPLFVLDGDNYYLRHVLSQYNYLNFEVAYTASDVTLTYGSGSGLCIASDAQIAEVGSANFTGSNSTVIFGNVKPVASRTR